LESKSRPFVFFVLALPIGIVGGFTTVTFPFIATKAGLPVGTTTSIVALGFLAQGIRIIWAPLADFALTLKTWCILGTFGIAGILLLISLVTLSTSHTALFCVLLFALNSVACIENTPVPGLLAHNVADDKKGAATGFYMAGVMGGTAAAGSVGLWIAQHTGSQMLACGALALGCFLSLAGLFFVKEPLRHLEGMTPGTRFKVLGRDIWQVVKTPAGFYIVVLVMMPIGLGAVGNFWPAIAPEWHVSADLMAFISGVGTTVATFVGCLVGGWVADRINSIKVFLGASLVLCAIGSAMAFGHRTPMLFAGCSLIYMFAVGMCNASYGAMIYRVIGRGAAAFKYTAINSLGNFPVSYMTAFDGYVHDRSGSAVMLNTESGICLLLILIFGAVQRRLRI
jgi:PAT family beta-lactamase induction signal transducer AmpG